MFSDKLLIGIFLIIFLVIGLRIINPIFFNSETKIESIDTKYQIEYFKKGKMGSLHKKGEKTTDDIFDGTIDYFGFNKEKTKIYCLVKKRSSVGKSGWYSLEFSTDSIEFVQDKSCDIHCFSKLFNIEVVNTHTFFGYREPR